MRTRHVVLISAVLLMGLQLPATSLASGRHRSEPIVIGHRGAPAYRPEHTIGSYQLAIDMGADFIEPDLVSTKDHVLVARHENNITGTTDVGQHPEFADLKRDKVIDGTPMTGWFTEDFTLAQLKTLRAVERLPALRPANTAFDGVYAIPTFQEVIDLAKREHVGIYPETKHPTYFDGLTGLDGHSLSLEEPLVAALKSNGLDRRDAKVFVQSFEVSNLKQLNRMTKVPLVQLTGATGGPFDDPSTSYAAITSPAGLRDVARYADGLGPDKNQIVPRDATQHLTEPTSLVKDAHRAGLLVHPYTFRPENNFLPADFREGNPNSPMFLGARGNQPAELKFFYRLGVDGVFADNPDTAVAVRRRVFR